MQKKVYFIADAHLGATCVPNSKEKERRLVAWLDSVKESASAIYMLGDMFDFWFEYEYVVPSGFTRFLGKLSELADAGVELHFFTGNHDIWTFGYLEKEVGMKVHRKEEIVEIMGRRFFLAHGDGLGDPSLRFKFLRAFFHNYVCQRLFAMLHHYIAMSVGLLWSGKSRKKKENRFSRYLGEEKEHLVQFVKKYDGPAVDYFIFGHRHILLDETFGGRRMLILGDWISLCSYAEFDGETLALKQAAE